MMPAASRPRRPLALSRPTVDLGLRCDLTELYMAQCAHCRHLPDPIVELGTTWTDTEPAS